MSYTITIHGHLDDPEAEEKIKDQAQEFVNSLEGVNLANFSAQGSHALYEAPPPPPEPEEEPEVPAEPEEQPIEEEGATE